MYGGKGMLLVVVSISEMTDELVEKVKKILKIKNKRCPFEENCADDEAECFRCFIQNTKSGRFRGVLLDAPFNLKWFGVFRLPSSRIRKLQELGLVREYKKFDA
jgi:hypothetical protein